MRCSTLFSRGGPIPAAGVLWLAIVIVPASCGVGVDSGDVTPELRVRRGDLHPRLLMSGELVAAESVQLRVPQTPERRVQLRRLVEDGKEVAAGEVLAEFDNTSFASNLESSRSDVYRAEKALQQARADAAALLEESNLAVERTRITLEKAELDIAVPERLQSRLEHSEIELALERARAEHEKAQDDLRAARASGESDIQIRVLELGRVRRQLAKAESAIDALQLVAPRDGIAVVADNPREGRRLQPGDTVWIGLPVVSLPDLSRLRVSAVLSDVDDGRIAVGAVVVCTIDAYPELEIGGRVQSIAPFAEELRWGSLRRGFEVTVELDHTPEDPPLVPGMSVRVEAPLQGAEDVPLAPRAALVFDSDGVRARIPNGWKTVELGPCGATECVVLEGLEPGDRVLPVLESSS